MAKLVTFKPVESEKLNENEPVLKYKLLTSKAYPPTRETARSIGYDLRSPRFARISPKGGTYYLLRYRSRCQDDIFPRKELIPSFVLSSDNTNCKNDIQLFHQLFDELSVHTDYH